MMLRPIAASPVLNRLELGASPAETFTLASGDS